MSPQLMLRLEDDTPMDPSLVLVTILHDERSFGRKGLLEDGSSPKLRQVFDCWAPALFDPIILLEKVYEEFNIGETSAVAREYRANGLRSLSTGDVVVIGDTAFRCDNVGWAKFALPPRT